MYRKETEVGMLILGGLEKKRTMKAMSSAWRPGPSPTSVVLKANTENVTSDSKSRNFKVFYKTSERSEPFKTAPLLAKDE
eukprot:scaffold70731_cov17-Tisochrysis_lutea.AAC.2